ncbi:unnamed protein product [Rotaria socialis]|uniref:F-box domain-containing protein n=1 Tax=Rotaria socialis TaxID=392032 RepID=A0A821C982_9BILA|nr:unnamed protein product [Rotaria socialis]CAF4605159.1 unnamed protein product [Rotaria socialis]
MENVPVELLEKILLHFNSTLPELLSISVVSRQWHSLISDELFLNKWAQRRFARHPAIQLTMEEEHERWKDGQEHRVHVLPFPCPISSSSFTVVKAESKYRSNSIPAIQGDYSLAFWIYNFDGSGKLEFQVNSKSTDQVLRFEYDKYHRSAHIYFGGISYTAKELPYNSSRKRPWCHFVVNVRQGGQVSLWCSRLKCELKTDNCSMQLFAPKQEGDFVEVECSFRFWIAPLVDIRLFLFCLTSVDIYSIYEQESTFDLVKVGTGRKELVKHIRELREN